MNQATSTELGPQRTKSKYNPHRKPDSSLTTQVSTCTLATEKTFFHCLLLTRKKLLWHQQAAFTMELCHLPLSKILLFQDALIKPSATLML